MVLVSFLMIIHRVERGSDFAPDFEFGLQSQDEIKCHMASQGPYVDASSYRRNR